MIRAPRKSRRIKLVCCQKPKETELWMEIGDGDGVAQPEPAQSLMAMEIWQHTCVYKNDKQKKKKKHKKYRQKSEKKNLKKHQANYWETRVGVLLINFGNC